MNNYDRCMTCLRILLISDATHVDAAERRASTSSVSIVRDKLLDIGSDVLPGNAFSRSLRYTMRFAGDSSLQYKLRANPGYVNKHSPVLPKALKILHR